MDCPRSRGNVKPMKTTNTTPEPKIVTVDPSDAPLDFESHDNIPFGWLPVVALGQPEVRKTLAMWYEPDHASQGPANASSPPELDFDDGKWHEIDVSAGPGPDARELYKLLYAVAPRGFCEVHGKDAPPVPIQVRLVLDYPLQHTWAATITLDARELGIVFAAAHDMYRQIFALDDQAWRDGGHDTAPRGAPGLANRAGGKYVWGHDFTDLVFESLLFARAPGVQPFARDRVYDVPTFIGTIAFGIGS